MLERLHKVLARAGVAALRPAEDMIMAGRVTVNGRIVRELGARVDAATDTIAVDGQPVEMRQPTDPFHYLAVYKPVGIISTARDTHGRPTVVELVPSNDRLFPVGRLDADSEGLILLADDGDLAYRLTHPRFEVEKEYRVLLDHAPSVEDLRRWREGVELGGETTMPAWVETLERTADGTWVRIVMREGRKRQIREVARLLGYDVRRLIRVREGPLMLGDLRPGDWRELSPSEIQALRAHTQHIPSRAEEEREKIMSDRDRPDGRRLRVIRGSRRTGAEDDQRTAEQPRFTSAQTSDPAPRRARAYTDPTLAADTAPEPVSRANETRPQPRAQQPAQSGQGERRTFGGGDRPAGERGGRDTGARPDTRDQRTYEDRGPRRTFVDRGGPRRTPEANGPDRGFDRGNQRPDSGDRGNQRFSNDDRGNQRFSNERGAPDRGNQRPDFSDRGNRGGPGDNRGGFGGNRNGPGDNRGGFGGNRNGPGDNRGGFGGNRNGPNVQRGGYGSNRSGPGDNRGGPSNDRGDRPRSFDRGPSSRPDFRSDRTGGPPRDRQDRDFGSNRSGPGDSRPSENRGGFGQRSGPPRRPEGDAQDRRSRPGRPGEPPRNRGGYGSGPTNDRRGPGGQSRGPGGPRQNTYGNTRRDEGGGDARRGDIRGGLGGSSGGNDQRGDIRGGLGRGSTGGSNQRGDIRGGLGRGSTGGTGQRGNIRGGLGGGNRTGGGRPWGERSGPARGGFGRTGPGERSGGFGRSGPGSGSSGGSGPNRRGPAPGGRPTGPRRPMGGPGAGRSSGSTSRFSNNRPNSSGPAGPRRKRDDEE